MLCIVGSVLGLLFVRLWCRLGYGRYGGDDEGVYLVDGGEVVQPYYMHEAYWCEFALGLSWF